MANSQVNFKRGSQEAYDRMMSANADTLYFVDEPVIAKDDSGWDVSYAGSVYLGNQIIGTSVANKLVTKEDITIAGVEVGNLNSAFPDGIPAGTSVEEIITAMLCKPIDVHTQNPSVSCKFNSGASVNTTYEVGTVLDVVLGNTYTDGRFIGDEGYDYNIAAGCSQGEVTYYCNGTAFEGNEKEVTLTAAGDTIFKCSTAYGASSVVPKTNLKKDSSASIPAGTANSGNIKFSAAFKYFVGYSDKTLATEFDSDSIRALNAFTGFCKTSGTTQIVANGTKATSDGRSIVVAVPAGYTLKSIDNFSPQAPYIDKFESIADIENVACAGEKTVTYRVYVWPITSETAIDYTNLAIQK